MKITHVKNILLNEVFTIEQQNEFIKIIHFEHVDECEMMGDTPMTTDEFLDYIAFGREFVEGTIENGVFKEVE